MTEQNSTHAADEYQHDFSLAHAGMYDNDIRTRKALTSVRVLQEVLGNKISTSKILNVGSSAGIMDAVYCEFFAEAVGVDIDENAVNYARSNFNRPNLRFEIGDGLNLPFTDASFDVVVCSQVYEHVPDQKRLMEEIWRVLNKNGVCYFSATNRFIVVEPHYRLWFLSWLPASLANTYVRLFKKGTQYYERMRSLPKLRQLVSKFRVVDFTVAILRDPVAYDFDYVVQPASAMQRASVFIASRLPWLCPGFIWILQKDVA